MLATSAALTVDAFIGGAVEVVQPARGHHRSGLDAVLLASGLGAGASGHVADLGSGAGVAGLVIAARAPGCAVVLVEREAELVTCAEAALALPANASFTDRVRVARVDLLDNDSRHAAGLLPESFDHAVMNPPFHDEDRVRSSPNDARARAHVLEQGGLDRWFRAAAALIRPRGTLSVILPAERIDALLQSCHGRFGGLSILPIHPRPDAPALRVLARGIKGSRAASRLLPGLVLHGADGSTFQPAVAAILREGADLGSVHPSWFDPAWGEPPSSELSRKQTS